MKILKITFLFMLLTITSIPIIAQWTKTDNSLNQITNTLGSNGPYIFAGTKTSGIFRSNNFGLSWTASNLGMVGKNVSSIVANGSLVFLSTIDNWIFVSSNNGNSWNYAISGNSYPFNNITTLLLSGNNLFAGSYNGIIRSTNDGFDWAYKNSGIANSIIWIRSFAANETDIYVGLDASCVYRSSNNGESWWPANNGLNTLSGLSLAIDKSFIYVGTRAGIYRSSDKGNNWKSINTGLTNTYVRCINITNSNIFVGTDVGIYRSTNNGDTWTSINTGLNTQKIYSLLTSGQYLFAAGDEGVWKRSLSEVIVGVQESFTEIPSYFKMDQNYPNPFNPSTNIKYQLSQKCFVTLSIYNILGKEVIRLVNEEKNAGYYDIKYDAKNLPSGVYLYMIQAGEYRSVKKMSFIK